MSKDQYPSVNLNVPPDILVLQVWWC